MSQKVVVCSAGFLGVQSYFLDFLTTQFVLISIGSNIAKCLINVNGRHDAATSRRVQLSSRQPGKPYAVLKSSVQHQSRLLPPVPVDITKPETLTPSFKDAAFVVSLVGLLNGSPKDFEEIQWKGAENVAKAAKSVGAKLIHVSAIGADINSSIPYARTKALAEASVFDICPDATVIRPSIVFGPGDSFFNVCTTTRVTNISSKYCHGQRFARISRFLPFLPVFGGGKSRLQPVFVGDVARAVEIISRNDKAINKLVSGKIIEAGGPEGMSKSIFGAASTKCLSAAKCSHIESSCSLCCATQTVKDQLSLCRFQ